MDKVTITFENDKYCIRGGIKDGKKLNSIEFLRAMTDVMEALEHLDKKLVITLEDKEKP